MRRLCLTQALTTAQLFFQTICKEPRGPASASTPLEWASMFNRPGHSASKAPGLKSLAFAYSDHATGLMSNNQALVAPTTALAAFLGAVGLRSSQELIAKAQAQRVGRVEQVQLSFGHGLI